MDLEYKNHVFIHIYRVNNWMEILDEQLNWIEIAAMDVKVHLSVEYYEAFTLRRLYDFAFYHRSANILYLHSKGVTSFRQPYYKKMEAWRHYMQYFLIKKHKTALQLLRKSDAVGVEWKPRPKEGKRKYIGQHYAGNFWWSTSEHIRQLRDPIKLDLRVKYDPETWIASRPHGIYLSMYQQDQTGDSRKWDWSKFKP